MEDLLLSPQSVQVVCEWVEFLDGQAATLIKTNFKNILERTILYEKGLG